MKNMRGFVKVILSLVMVMLFGFMLCGCGQQEELVDVDVEAKSEEFGLDWESIVEHVKAAKLQTLYADQESLEDDAKEFGFISFSNYDPTDPGAFKKVDYQMTLSYGIILKDDGSTYDRSVYEICLIDNQSDKNYMGVYDETGKLINEVGAWFLNESKDETVANYISEVNAAIR